MVKTRFAHLYYSCNFRDVLRFYLLAYGISGLKKEPKVLIGRAGIKIPFLERKDELMLKQISIDIKTK